MSVDGGATWHTAQGTTGVDLPGLRRRPDRRRFGAARSTTVATSRPGAASRSPSATAVPVHSLWAAGDSPAGPSTSTIQPGRSRREVQQRCRRLHHGRALLQGRCRTPARTSATCGPAPARCWRHATFTNETPSGWQEVLLDAPVAIAANTTYVASYHTNVGRYSATAGYFSTTARRRVRRCTRSASGRRRQRRLCVRRQRVPDPDLQRDQLLGRRRLRQHPGHDGAADRKRAGTPIDSAIADVTWTTTSRRPRRSIIDRQHVPARADGHGPGLPLRHGAHIRLTGLVTNTTIFACARLITRATRQ